MDGLLRLRDILRKEGVIAKDFPRHLLEKEWDDPAVMPSYAQLDLVLEEEDEVVGNEDITF